jgi:phosphonate transport system permease protein
MFPPSTSRLLQIGQAVLETFQMALVGTVIGVALSLPLAWLATRGLTPHPALYYGARGLIALFRTVPDLIWALFFVVAVGLGPFAGTLALAVDTMGFCGRFFAEAMEEQDKGPQEALRAIGASRSGVLMGAVIPGALPSFINTSLFSLEKATRSSVVLGLVGAGGIGIELKVAMDMFEYDQAATIILFVFALVLLVERASAYLRARVIG